MFKIAARWTNTLLAGAMALGVHGVVPTSALAQAGPAAPVTQTTEAADKANPPTAKWKEDLTVGAQVDDGRANTKAVRISGDAWAKYGAWLVRFDGSEDYGSISRAGVSIVSIDSQYGSVSFSHDFSKKFYFTQIDSFARDEIRLLDHRVSSMNAIGVRRKKGKVAFDFGPGIALVNQQKHTPEVDGFKVDAGGFYSLVYDVAPKWEITQWAIYRNDVSYPKDKLIDASAAITGMITKVVGLKVALTYNYEGVLSAGALATGFATKNYLTTTIGLTVRH